jgi:hypothetical protein
MRALHVRQEVGNIAIHVIRADTSARLRMLFQLGYKEFTVSFDQLKIHAFQTRAVSVGNFRSDEVRLPMKIGEMSASGIIYLKEVIIP